MQQCNGSGITGNEFVRSVWIHWNPSKNMTNDHRSSSSSSVSSITTKFIILYDWISYVSFHFCMCVCETKKKRSKCYYIKSEIDSILFVLNFLFKSISNENHKKSERITKLKELPGNERASSRNLIGYSLEREQNTETHTACIVNMGKVCDRKHRRETELHACSWVSSEKKTASKKWRQQKKNVEKTKLISLLVFPMAWRK